MAGREIGDEDMVPEGVQGSDYRTVFRDGCEEGEGEGRQSHMEERVARRDSLSLSLSLSPSLSLSLSLSLSRGRRYPSGTRQPAPALARRCRT